MYNLENPFSQQQVVAKCVSSVVYNSHISRREKPMCHSPLNRKIFVDGGGGGVWERKTNHLVAVS